MTYDCCIVAVYGLSFLHCIYKNSCLPDFIPHSNPTTPTSVFASACMRGINTVSRALGISLHYPLFSSLPISTVRLDRQSVQRISAQRCMPSCHPATLPSHPAMPPTTSHRASTTDYTRLGMNCLMNWHWARPALPVCPTGQPIHQSRTPSPKTAYVGTRCQHARLSTR